MFSASLPVSSFGGMGPPPFLICVATRSAVSGARLSRSGPTLPVVPASLSAWQPPHVALKAVLPAARSAPELPPVVVPVLSVLPLLSVLPPVDSPVVGALGFVPTEPAAVLGIHRRRAGALTHGDLPGDGRTGDLRREAAGRSDGDGGEDEKHGKHSTGAHAE